MRVLNFGSLNIDYVYKVENFVQPGETILVSEFSVFAGGKGLNQSIALAKAGAKVSHAGKIGKDGTMLLDKLKEYNVDSSLVEISDEATGHAVIQVDSTGQNCIFIHGGTNRQITNAEVDRAIEKFGSGDILLLQNEINNIPYIMKKASEKGLKIAMNPAPMNKDVLAYPLELVDILVVNEIEGKELTGKADPNEIGEELLRRNPNGSYIITLGEKGLLYIDKAKQLIQGIYEINVVDTTGAGDTFLGYFLAGVLENMETKNILEMAAKASAICVSRPGAADSIPLRNEVDSAELKLKQ